MNYVYDVLLNYKEYAYEFYDWNVSDELTHVRKIPTFKVSSETLRILKQSKAKMGEEFLEILKNKTEVFANRKVKNLEYAFILCDGTEAVAFSCNEFMIVDEKSKMLLDEELEVLEVAERMRTITIDYQVIGENIIYSPFRTRKDIEVDHYVKEQLHRLKSEESVEKLKYLYYECFNKKIEDIDEIFVGIQKELTTNWDSISHKIYNFLRLVSSE